MFRMKSLLLTVFCLTIIPIAASAETHNVTLGNNFFSPNDLTIQVGDTVKWSHSAGRMHDVTADDSSFNSETAISFTFERTFNSAEEILYHCTVHSSPGMDRNTRMNGRITVTEPDAQPILIVPSMADAWFFPVTSGQGFFITVWDDLKIMFVAWFTYDTERPPEDVMAMLGEPGHRWITAQGSYEGDTATLEIFVSKGGVFDSAEPPVDPAVKDGTMTIIWSGCNEAIVIYEISSLGLSDEIPIQRLTPDNIAACVAAQPQ